MLPTESYIETSEGRIFVRQLQRQKSVCLVFIHGFLAHGHWWDWLVSALDDQYDWVILDLPGMGQSDDQACYDITAMAHAVNTVVKACTSAQAVYLVAHSFGALVASHALLAAPTLTQGMFCIDMDLAHLSIATQPSQLPRQSRRYHAEKNSLLARFRLLPPQTSCAANILEVLAQQSITHYPSGWAWAFDPNVLNIRKTDIYSAFKTAYDKNTWFMGLIIGEYSTVINQQRVQENWRQWAHTAPATIVLPGYHHLMLDCPSELASAIQTQLNGVA